MTRHTIINPDGLAEIPGANHVVVAKGSTQVYLSGQTPTGPDGSLVGEGDLAEQARVVFENLKTCLAAAGATPQDIVRSTIYVVDYEPSCLDGIFAGAIAAFGEDLPTSTSTLVGVTSLFVPGQLIEVDAIAVLD